MFECVLNSNFQRRFGALLDALHAENTFRCVCPGTSIVGHIHLHRTDFFAFAAGNALALIAGDTEGGKVTHGL